MKVTGGFKIQDSRFKIQEKSHSQRRARTGSMLAALVAGMAAPRTLATTPATRTITACLGSMWLGGLVNEEDHGVFGIDGAGDFGEVVDAGVPDGDAQGRAEPLVDGVDVVDDEEGA